MVIEPTSKNTIYLSDIRAQTHVAQFLAHMKALEHGNDPLVEAKKKKLSTLNNVHKAKAFYKRKKLQS